MKNSQLQIRISDSQKSALQRAAALDNMDVSNWVLSKLFKSARTQFLEKIEILSTSERKYALADLADFLKNLSPEKLQEILQTPWSTQLEPIAANYVAAMLELCAHRLKIQPAYWLSSIEPLETPYFASELKSLRLYLLQVSPPPFRARNIFIDTTLEGRV